MHHPLPLMAAFLASLGTAWPATEPTYTVPRLTEAKIDAYAADWTDAFNIAALAGTTDPIDPADLWADAGFAWDQTGLLVLIHVHDQVVEEGINPTDFAEKDSVEIVICPHPENPAHGLRFVISPGLDARFPRVRSHVEALPAVDSPARPPAPEVAVKKFDHGYLVEARLPWEALGVAAADGLRLGCRLLVHDADKQGLSHQSLVWAGAGRPGNDLHVLTLGQKATPPVVAAAWAARKKSGEVSVFYTAPAVLPADSVEVKPSWSASLWVPLTRKGPAAIATAVLPAPAPQDAAPHVVIDVPGGLPSVVYVGELAQTVPPAAAN